MPVRGGRRRRALAEQMGDVCCNADRGCVGSCSLWTKMGGMLQREEKRERETEKEREGAEGERGREKQERWGRGSSGGAVGYRDDDGR